MISIALFLLPANEKRKAVDRLFWNFSKEVYFLCFFTGDSLRQESHRFRILKRKTIQNSEDNRSEKIINVMQWQLDND